MPAQQQQINYGNTANDGQGDPLRTAFVKTDDNFDAIWNAGPVGSNITIVNNTISTVNSNGNLILKPNGVANVQVNSSVLPDISQIRDLGSANLRWRSLSVGTGGINNSGNLVTLNLTTTGDAVIQGNLTVQGDVIQVGNITTDSKTVQLANTAVTDVAADGSGVTVGANDDIATLLYNGTNNEWRTNIGANVAGNVTANYFIGDGSLLTGLPAGYANADAAAYGEAGWAGNIVPAANLTYSLGNSTNWWSNLWIASNTIYIGGVPLGITGNVLTVDGEPVLSNDSDSSITTTGNITANYFIGDGSLLTGLPEQYGNANVVSLLSSFGSNTISTTGDITANSFIGDGSQLTGLPASYGNANVAAYLPTYGGNILVDRVIGNTTDNSGYLQWQGNSSGDNNGYTTLRLVPDDTLVDNDQYLIIDPTDPYHIHIRAGGTQDNSQAQLFLGGESNYVRVVDGTGVRLQNQTRDNTFYNYSDPADFNTGTWYESGGTYFVQYTTADAELIDVSFQFNDDSENTLRVFYNGGASDTVLTSAGSVSNLGGGVYRVSVNEAPPASPTAITALEYEIWSNRTNSVQLQSNDFTVSVTDDVRITGNDTFSLRNTGLNAPIQIITNYNGASKMWEFGADGTLETPGDIVVSGDITGTAGASTLVLAAEPSSNTYIQLNDTVDSTINTVANLEIRTDVANTAKTWVFDTTGNLTAPGNIAAGNIITTGNITSGNLISDKIISSTGSNVELEVGEFQWRFDSNGETLLPGNIIADFVLTQTVGGFANVILEASDGNGNTSLAVWKLNGTDDGTLDLLTGNITAGNVALSGNISATNFIVSESLISSGASPAPIISGFRSASITGNITGGNLISSATIFGNPDLILGNVANAEATKTRIATFGANSYIQTGNGTVGSTGNIVFAPYLDSTEKVVIDTATGNVTAQNFVGNITITGNVTGTSANVDLVAGAYEWSFDNTGNVTLPGNTFAVNYANGAPVNPVTKFAAAWTVPTGNSTQSFTVPGSNTYVMWVEGNIPNGIVTWNATVSVTNDNVPVLGQQQAWNYEGGGSPLLITSIPDQIVGTAGAISNAAPSVANASTFTFGFNNTSGSERTVRYGWTQISNV